MGTKTYTTAVALLVLALCAWALQAQESGDNGAADTNSADNADNSASRSTSETASKPASRPARNKKVKQPPKFATPTEDALKESAAALDKVGKDLQEIMPDFHKYQSAHFTIFSSFGKATDKAIADACEATYRTLSGQLDVLEDEPVWIGKCGVVLLPTGNQFVRFKDEVDKKVIPHRDLGYFKGDAKVACIVINAADELVDYKGTVVHETTHAFMSRYVTEAVLPAWLGESVAEATASSLAPSKHYFGRARRAAKEALKGKEVMHLFKSIDAVDFDYGILQGWGRYLMARDRKAFVKMVTLFKQGKEEDIVWKESYKIDRDQFLRDWAAAAAKSLRP